jgi:hypothetical protein
MCAVSGGGIAVVPTMLNAKSLQRLDEATAALYETAQHPIGVSVPARDLQSEYKKKLKMDAERFKKARRGQSASPENRSPKFSPRSSPLEREAESGKSGTGRKSASPKPVAAAKHLDPATPEALYWRTYVKRDVVSRLRDTEQIESRRAHLRSELRKKEAEECPFEPALAIRTVMDTHAGSRNRKSDRKDVSMSGNFPSGANVRVVTIRAPHGDGDTDDDGDPPPTTAKRKAEGPPHYMMPLPLPPPPAPPRKLALTRKAALLKRGPKARNAWLTEKEERLSEAMAQRARLDEEHDLSSLQEPQLCAGSAAIVEGLADRRVDVLSDTTMRSLAAKSAAMARIEAIRQNLHRDLRYQAVPEYNQATKPEKFDINAFMTLVKRETAVNRTSLVD